MDLGAFSRLEVKIEELLGRLAALDEENRELRSRLNEKSEIQSRLEEQKAGWDQERSEVRQRVENLVEKLETM